MNNLIFVQWTNNFGGLEKISADYEKIFSKFNPAVLALKSKESGITYENPVILKDQNNPLKLRLNYFNFVRKNKNAIFHLQYPGAVILFLTYLAGAKKIIFHFHGTKFSNNFFERSIWKLLKNKITVISNSNHTAKVVKGKLDVEDSIIIPNFINTNYFSFDEKCYDDGKFIVSYAGRFTKGKNIDKIIETAKELQNEDIEFRIYGDGPEKEHIENLVKQNNLQNVKLPGFTKDIVSVYKQCHLFLFLSGYESFGNVVAESILCGTPPLCFKIPSLQEFIKDEDFFVEKLNSNLIAEKILFVKKNYKLLIMKLSETHKFLSGYLDNDSIKNKLISIYSKI